MKIKLLIAAVTIVLVTALIGGFTMAWFTDADKFGPVEFAAGTVQIEAGSSRIASQYFDAEEGVFVYGVEGVTGDLYEINVLTHEEHLIFANPKNYSGFYPNALAFDEVNDRLYFAANKEDLYFYDFSNDTLVFAGKFPNTGKHVYGATFGGGYFWYVPNDTADLYKISFKEDGTIADYSYETMTDENYKLGFGDVVIAYADGIIYGSSTSIYFTYNTVTKEFKNLGKKGSDLQLAWGHDGILYGHNTSDYSWYIVNPGTGDTFYQFSGERAYNDLAPGSTSYWNPGDHGWAKFTVQNVGTKRCFVRLAISESWQEKVDNNWQGWNPPDGEQMVTTTPVGESASSWVKVGNYYYYNKALNSNESADIKFDVHFLPQADNNYQGKRFVLLGEFEAVQVTHNAAGSLGWDYIPDIPN